MGPRPEITNLINIYTIFLRLEQERQQRDVWREEGSASPLSAYSPQTTVTSSASNPQEVSEELDRRGLSTAAFKTELADLIAAHVESIGAEYRRLRADQQHLEVVLEEGEERARTFARETM